MLSSHCGWEGECNKLLVSAPCAHILTFGTCAKLVIWHVSKTMIFKKYKHSHRFDSDGLFFIQWEYWFLEQRKSIQGNSKLILFGVLMVYFQLRKSFLIQGLSYLRWSLSKMELFTIKVSLHDFTKSAWYKFYLSTVSGSAIITNSLKVSPKFKKEIALPVLENYLGDWFIWFMIELFSSCSMKLRIYCGEDY